MKFKIEIIKQPFVTGLVVGVVSGVLLGTFFMYLGLFLFPLFCFFYALEKNETRKLHWAGFILGAMPTVIFMVLVVYPHWGRQ